MGWTAGDAPPQVVHGREMRLVSGRACVEALVIGTDPASEPAAVVRNEGLTSASGTGCLVVSSWGLFPGFARVQLPETKTVGKK